MPSLASGSLRFPFSVCFDRAVREDVGLKQSAQKQEFRRDNNGYIYVMEN